MHDDHIPTLGAWLKTLPTWKAVLFVWWQEHIGLPSALMLFGYERAKRRDEKRSRFSFLKPVLANEKQTQAVPAQPPTNRKRTGAANADDPSEPAE